jgi:hypothetical protein
VRQSPDGNHHSLPGHRRRPAYQRLGTPLRKQTAEHFGLDYEEIYHRHHVTYDIYEEGKMTLDEYLLADRFL